jgi:hypothetical protein
MSTRSPTRSVLGMTVLATLVWCAGVTRPLAADEPAAAAKSKKQGDPSQQAAGSEKAGGAEPAAGTGKGTGATVATPEPFPPPKNLVRLAKDYDIWLDQERKQLIVDGKIALREGQLEMFACPRHTKEHESIVSVNCKAQFVHAGLLALGAEPGRPVQFNPEYQPARGPEVEVWVLWKDEQGNHKVRAQEWIVQTQTGKTLEHPFVFAGSGFHVDEITGEKHYLAEGGDLICVSNFTSATLDLPIKSSQENSSLNFRANTEKIPPVGTPVRLVLAPKLMEKGAPPGGRRGGDGSRSKNKDSAEKTQDR